MLVGLVVVRDQVVDTLKQGGQGAAIVFLLHEELLLREDLDEINQAITSLATQLLSVRCEVGNHSHNRLVDRLK